ncbi:S-layer family protein [Paenibacillus taihuensis]|uniref:S-layer family protein n=1 Tax=Paenibacillus taihuensis TaxID=1156355 RepID=A0A3D9S4V6_9BACL|nr:S-layer homology domain-containing protein [Paenibacillus taihuensis]REE85306.1 S-layer family protein [Paenibacillus taihuensis]
MSKKTSRKTSRAASQVVSSLVIGSMLLTSTTAMASPNQEISNQDTSNHWAAKELQKWTDIGLLKGDSHGNLNPNEAITRAEFITILNRIFNLQSTSGARSFADAHPGDWYYEELQKASAAGLLNGDANSHANPKAPITRQEAAALIARGFQVVSGTADARFGDSSQIASWASDAVSSLASKGYLNGRGNNEFAPHANITRAESFVMTDRVMGTIIKTPEDLAKLASPVTGNVTIALPGAVLKNLVIAGDIYVIDAAATEPVVLNNVKVTGDLSVVSAKSVNLIGSTVSGTTLVKDTKAATALNLDAGSSLNRLVLNSTAAVSGEGSIITAVINANGSTIAQQPAQVTVANGVTSTVGGKTVTSGGGTGGNTGGGTSNLTTPVVPAISTGTTVNMYSTQITHLQPTGLNLGQPIKWTTSDPYIAYVDTVGNDSGNYAGKVIGVSTGTAAIIGKQGDTSITITVHVTNDPNLTTVLDKLVYYYEAHDSHIPSFSNAPELIHGSVSVPTGRSWPSESYAGYLEGTNGVKWMLASDMKSVTLYDPNLSNPDDRIQYLQGGRYIPQDAAGSTQAISKIMTDGSGGLWIKDAAGDATHIVRKNVSLESKAMLEQEIMKNFDDRFGMTSNDTNTSSHANKIAAIMGSKDARDLDFKVEVGDNDGSITATFGRSQIFYYKDMLSKYGANDERTKDALKAATRTTEAVALLPYISGRQMKVPAKEEAKPYILELLGAKADGSDEGKPVYLDENGKYTLTDTGKPAPDGFLPRTFTVIPQGQDTSYLKDNAYFQKGAGTTKDINGKDVAYSKLINVSVSADKEQKNQYSALKAYDSVPVPQRLAKLYEPNGAVPENTIYYKDSTSSDELNNDFSFYTLAYQTFRNADPQLASLLKTAIVTIANHTIINNYHIAGISANKSRDLYPDYQTGGAKSSPGFVNSGNGLNVPNYHTRWGNFEPEFMDGANDPIGGSDYEDGPLNMAIGLEILQLAMMVDEDTAIPYYNGNGFYTPKPIDFQEEYSTLIEPAKYKARYPRAINSTSALDTMQQYMTRYFSIAEHNGDDFGEPGTSFEAYLNTGDEHKMINIMYSLVNTMPNQPDTAVLNAYKTTFDQWWYNVKRYRDAWATYYHALILAKFKQLGVDVSHDEVDIKGANHSLSRFPSNGGHWDVDNTTRTDVTSLIYGDSTGWLDQALPRDEMRSYTVGEDLFDPNQGGKLSLYNQVAFILPVWMSVLPENVQMIDSLGSKAKPNNGPAPVIKDAVTNSTTVNLTLNVGEQKTLNVTGTENAYVKNIIWNTSSWTQDTQIIDLKNLYSYDALEQKQFFPAQVTAVQPGTATVTALTADGFSPAPKTVVYNITVAYPNSNATAKENLTQVTDSDFAYPIWLKEALADQKLNTNGHRNVSIAYASSNESAGSVDPETGAITYLSHTPFDIIATVTYSDMTINGDPMFEKSHVMTYVTPVVTNLPIVSLQSTALTRLQPEGFELGQPISWTTSDPYVAYVDTVGNDAGQYDGKVLGVSNGSAKITAVQGALTASYLVNVTEATDTNLEKLVYYYAKDDSAIPSSLAAAQLTDTIVPAAPNGLTWPSASYAGYVNGTQGAKWMLAADKLSITLYDPNNAVAADQVQYLQVSRYIPTSSPQNAEPIASIMSDHNGGLWILGTSGDATHIVRKQMSLTAKTLLLDEVGRNLNDRMGFQSGTAAFNTKADMYAALMGSKDQSNIARSLSSTDNDGLWTTMYGAGEIYRYNYMKDAYGADDARTKDALKSATRAVESDLMLAFISQRQLKVPAAANVNNPDIYTLLGANPDGSDEGKPVYLNADGTFTLTNTGTPAPDGFVSRSYYAFDDQEYANASYLATKLNDKERWMEITNDTTTDVNGTEVKYSKPSNVSAFDASNFDYDSLKAYATVPVPKRLSDTFHIAGKHIFYKDTTSTDEMIGHLYFLNLAYDTFKNIDPELASLAKTAITNVTNHIIINNYYFVGVAPQIKNGNPVVPLLPEYRKNADGAGNPGAKYSVGYVNSGNGLNVPSTPTRWSYYNPEYMDGNVNPWGLSDYEDASLGAMLDLTMLQESQNYVADSSIPLYAGADDGYKTAKLGIIDYTAEFDMLTTPELYKARFPKVRNSNTLAEVAAQYHNRYFGISEHNGDGIEEDGTSFEDYLNYSDEEMAALGMAGLIASANSNTTDAVKQAYLKALNQWWYNEKRTNNPFLSYFYAMNLGGLKALGVDVSGSQVDLAGADWQLHRMPSNFMNVTVNNSARADLTNLLPFDSYDQLLPRDEVRSAKYNTNWLNPDTTRNNYTMEAPTGISLPYWLSVDPQSKALIHSLGSAITVVSDRTTGDIAIAPGLTQDITIAVGEQKDLFVTGQENSYIPNISWNTDDWAFIDLRTGESATNFEGKTYGSVVTGKKAGTATVTAWTVDGGSAAPRQVTFNITVVDLNSSAIAANLNQVSLANFKLPDWLTDAFANPDKNTDGNVWASVEYSSSSTADGTVDPVTGAVTYLTSKSFNVIATVTYSGMTLNGEPMFETDGHILTFVCPVQQPQQP